MIKINWETIMILILIILFLSTSISSLYVLGFENGFDKGRKYEAALIKGADND